jgi:oligopeptidase B
MPNEELKPPVARIIPFETIYNGEKYIDNYAWLKNKTDPEVISYLEAENAYLKNMMGHTEKFQEDLYREMVGRIRETDETVPEQIDQYFYYSRTEKGKQYRIYCRKKDNPANPEEILLDLNRLAEGHDYLSLGVYKVSPDHNYLAYSTDTDGSENYTLYIKDLNNGDILADRIENTASSAEWLADNKTIFYTILDETKRPYKVLKHIRGKDSAGNELVYHEADEAFYVNVSKTNSKEYLLVTMVSKTTSEAFYVSASDPSDRIKLVEPRRKDIEYYLEHHNDIFYVITNDDKATNFKVMKTPVKNPARPNWQEFIEHRETVRVDYIHVFKNFLVIYERENGLKNIRVKTEKDDYYIDFPEPVYSFEPSSNRVFDKNLLRFHYESLTTPESVFDYNLAEKTRELKKIYEVVGGYNHDDYQSERIFAKTGDGTMVPISLVYKKGIKKDGSNPFYLYSYGSYEISLDVHFSANRLSLLDRGFIFAIAHIRGGGDMGRQWYENGKFLKKKNTFTDFIACAEHLVKEKYTVTDKLVIMGGSAGGLLMGAVTNMRPDLFKVVVAHVPFVDVINTMMDPALPLTVIEYDEWGDPNVKEYYDYMKSYSPYDNVEAKDYPNMYITGGLNDPRVGYWEPAKWVSKLRAMKTGNNLLLLKTNMGAGHGGASGRYDHIKEVAEEYAFVLDMFGKNS